MQLARAVVLLGDQATDLVEIGQRAARPPAAQPLQGSAPGSEEGVRDEAGEDARDTDRG